MDNCAKSLISIRRLSNIDVDRLCFSVTVNLLIHNQNREYKIRDREFLIDTDILYTRNKDFQIYFNGQLEELKRENVINVVSEYIHINIVSIYHSINLNDNAETQ